MSPQVIEIVRNVLEQGLIYSLVVTSVYLSSRVISFDDLTVEGSFGIGGAVAALVVLQGLPIWLALSFSVLAGALAGGATATLHNKLRMNNLISGIVVTTALFSISLNLAGANAALPATTHIGLPVLLALAVAAIASITVVLRSDVGYLLRALGSNPTMLTSLGKSISGYKSAALMLGNGLTALAGALFVLWSGYFSVMGNVGTLVIGLAGLIIGEAISKRFFVMIVAGAIAYQALFALVLEFELSPSWNNMIKAGLIVALLAVRK